MAGNSDLRKAKGLTQKQVAEIIGVVPKTVSKWEKGLSIPDVQMLIKIAVDIHIKYHSFCKNQVQYAI